MSGLALSDTQLLILSAAAQRDDLQIALPDRLRGGAGQKVLAALLGKALIEEIPESEIERRAFDHDAAERLAYRISRQGLAAIGIESEDQELDTSIDANAANEDGPEQGVSEAGASPVSSDEEGDRPSGKLPSSGPQPTSPRSGSKLANVIELLSRSEGASIDELTAATDWLAHTTRAALTGLRKRGIPVERGKRGDGTTIYRSAPTAPTTVAFDSDAA